MEIEILVSRQCRSCAKAVTLWRSVCEGRGLSLEVRDADGEPGRSLVRAHDLKVLPAVLVNGRLRAVGVQSREQAETLLDEAT